MKSMKLFTMVGVIGISMLMTGCSTVFFGEPKAENGTSKQCPMQNTVKPAPSRNVSEPQIVLHYHFVIPCKWEKIHMNHGTNHHGLKADHRKQRGRSDWDRLNKKTKFIDKNFKKEKEPINPDANVDKVYKKFSPENYLNENQVVSDKGNV